MQLLNIELMRNPVNWLSVAAMAWLGMIAMSLLFAPWSRERLSLANINAAGQAPASDVENGVVTNAY